MDEKQKAWQSIETAPRDGSRILVHASWVWCDIEEAVCEEPQPRVAYWDALCDAFITVSSNPYTDYAVRPTHWMPLTKEGLQ